jgi:hypothetical protein
MRPSAGRTLAAVPTLAAAANGVAAIALATVLSAGVSLSYGPDNAAYIATHLAVWRAGWVLWIVAALSLLTFFAWWAVRTASPRLARIAVVIGALGVIADVTAEARLMAWSADLDVGGALRQSGIVANACYSIAGTLLMLATPRWPGRLALWGWAVWILGFGLSISTAISSDLGAQVLTAAIFVLFVPWLVIAGRWLS